MDKSKAEEVVVESPDEDLNIGELAVYPAKAVRGCYAIYITTHKETGIEEIFWLHHGEEEGQDTDLGKSYKTMLPAMKAVLADAQKHAGRGDPSVVAKIKRAITLKTKKK